MSETVGIIAMGEMGSAVARRLHERGATVIEHAILICIGALVAVTLVGSGLSPKTALRSVVYVAGIEPGGIEERPSATPEGAVLLQ